jgi:hypothetical protein
MLGRIIVIALLLLSLPATAAEISTDGQPINDRVQIAAMSPNAVAKIDQLLGKRGTGQQLAANPGACTACYNFCSGQMQQCMKGIVRGNMPIAQCNSQQASCLNNCKAQGC